MENIYMDHIAGTPVLPEALAAMKKAAESGAEK
jgi:cysteine sulfinate desulfinase/cysteine desulfurase-like protein